MADINQIITLGVGTPSDIAHIILDGLNPEPTPVITVVGSVARLLPPGPRLLYPAQPRAHRPSRRI